MRDQTQVAEANARGRIKVRRALLRPLLDVSLVFAALCTISLVFGAAPSSAGPNFPDPSSDAMTMSPAVVQAIAVAETPPIVEIATTASPTSPETVFRRTSVQTAWVLLMLSLSVIVALNMALYRHMRRAYAPAKRRKS